MADEIAPEVGSWVRAFAAELGIDAPTQDEIDALLSLAGVAARGSARQAAPIACWLVARAGLDPVEARAVAERVSI